jgi:hypothetical protein
VGDCGVGWHCKATSKDISARTPRGEAQSTNIQRVSSCDLSGPCRFRYLASCLHFFMGSTLGTRGKPSKTSFSSRPAYIRLKQPAASENTSLRALLESHCPSVLSPFRPAWWLFKRVDTFFSRLYVLMQHSGHLQTLYAVLGNFSDVDPVVYDRQVLSHYYTNQRLIFTFAGSYSNLKMVEPCQAICFNLQELRSLLQQRH